MLWRPEWGDGVGSALLSGLLSGLPVTNFKVIGCGHLPAINSFFYLNCYKNVYILIII